MPKNNNAIYVKLNNLNPFLLKSDVYGKLSELGEVTHADAIQTKNYSTFAYSLVMALPLLAILFSWLTVWISCSRTLKTAASFSPIEAARYTPRHKNKAFTVISFALSGIVFLNIDYLNITDQEVDTDTKIHAGDVMELSFYEDSTDTYHIKEVTVMAVIEKDDRYGTGDISYNNIVLPDTLFQSIYPNYNERIASIQIVSKAGLNQQQIEAITNLVKKEHNTQIRMDSRYEDRNYYTHQKTSIMILGFFLALILGIIGISNMVNTLITDTLARKKEVLIFQAVGMTRKQLWKALFKKNLFLCFSSAIIVLVAGCYITVAVASASMFTGFNGMLFGVSFFLLIAFMVVLCAVLATIMTRQLNKKSVVERLREIE